MGRAAGVERVRDRDRLRHKQLTERQSRLLPQLLNHGVDIDKDDDDERRALLLRADALHSAIRVAHTRSSELPVDGAFESLDQRASRSTAEHEPPLSLERARAQVRELLAAAGAQDLLAHDAPAEANASVHTDQNSNSNTQ